MLELALYFFSRMFVFCRLLVSVCFFNSLSRQSHRDLLVSFSAFLSVLPFTQHVDSRLGVLWLLGALIPARFSCTPCTGVLFSSHFVGTAQLLYLLLHLEHNLVVCLNQVECYLENTAQGRSLGYKKTQTKTPKTPKQTNRKNPKHKKNPTRGS